VRSAIQQIEVEHRRRYNYRRILAELRLLRLRRMLLVCCCVQPGKLLGK
jgi:hypothetical protein